MVAKNSNWTIGSTMHVAPMDSTMNRHSNGKFLLWVDAVGGFLVCEGEKVSLGQAIPAAGVDLPIQADISRRHASIQRDAETYLIVPAQTTLVDQTPVARAAVLRNGCMIELGGGVKMQFHQPHPLTPTAKLVMASHHRLQPAVDGVILMSGAIVLGPAANSHVVARDWANEAILYRQNGQLIFRTSGSFAVDGVQHEGQAPVAPGARIEGKDFSMSLESV